jgi:branched-chain amino acid transport system substrate-binding protein
MTTRLRGWRSAGVAWALALGAAAPAHAADITLGQVAPLKNPASVGNQMKAGIELYFDVVNRGGGIGSHKLRLVSKDRVDAADSVAKTRELLRESRPVALIGVTGTGPMEALVKEGVLAEAAVPVIGIRTGATSLHVPMNPWLFHTRAHYGVEMRRIVEHLVPIGFKRFAIFHENSAFGREGRQHAEAALAAARLSPHATGSYEKDSTDVDAAVETIARARPDAVIAVGDTAAVAEFHKALRRAGSRPQVVTLSTVDAATVVKRIGTDAHGLGIAQVVPDPFHRKNAIARDYQDHAHKLRSPGFELTQAGIEGYIAAKVLVEGLRRCGPNPSPQQLRAALESLGRLDLGGISIEFSATQRSGTSYVNIGIIGPQGRLLQ